MKKSLLLGAICMVMNIKSDEFKLYSADFKHNEEIPKELTCEGKNKPPHLAWQGAHEHTRSLVLFCEDPDAPNGTWVHWVVYNIPPSKKDLTYIHDNKEKLSDGTMQGRNTAGNVGYDGPCPPSGHGKHHYHFKLYALNTVLSLEPGAAKDAVIKAMKNHIIGQTELIGLYQRK
jgi:Raf kinase inhibitor-like YbhB/YbcL family protein